MFKHKIQYIVLSMFLAIGLSSCDKTKPLHFLVGTWENTTSANDMYEAWKAVDGGLDGYSYILHNGDTMIMETLKIREEQGSVYLIVDVPSNSDEVKFRLESEDAGFTFSNTQHDFPKHINYQPFGGDSMTAKVYNDERKIDFAFKRVQ